MNKTILQRYEFALNSSAESEKYLGKVNAAIGEMNFERDIKLTEQEFQNA